MLVLKISQSIFFYINWVLTSNQGKNVGNGQTSIFHSIEALSKSDGYRRESNDLFVKQCTSADSFGLKKGISKGIKHKTECPLKKMESYVPKRILLFDQQKRQNNNSILRKLLEGHQKKNTILRSILEGRLESGTVSCSSSVRQEDVKSTRNEERSSFARKRKSDEKLEMAEVSSTIDENNKRPRLAKKSKDLLRYESLEENKSEEHSLQTTSNFELSEFYIGRKKAIILEWNRSMAVASKIVDAGDFSKEIDVISEASFNSLIGSVNTEDATREIDDTLVTDSGNLVISADTVDSTRETNDTLGTNSGNLVISADTVDSTKETNNDVAEINPDDLGRSCSTVDSTKETNNDVAEINPDDLGGSCSIADSTREINDTLGTNTGNLVISANTVDSTKETNNDVAEINPDDLGRSGSIADSTDKIDGSKIISPKRLSAGATLDPNDSFESQILEFFKKRKHMTLENLGKGLKNLMNAMNGKNNLILYIAPAGWRLSLFDILKRIDSNTLMQYELSSYLKVFSLNNIVDSIKSLKNPKNHTKKTREQLLNNYSILMGSLMVDDSRVYSYNLELLNPYLVTFDFFRINEVDENVDTYVPICLKTENGIKLFALIPYELRMRLACLRFLIINEMFQNSEIFLKLVQDFYGKNGL